MCQPYTTTCQGSTRQYDDVLHVYSGIYSQVAQVRLPSPGYSDYGGAHEIVSVVSQVYIQGRAQGISNPTAYHQIIISPLDMSKLVTIN